MRWLEEEVDYSGVPIGDALLDAQAMVHEETGKVLRLARVGAVSASALLNGLGSRVLLRGRIRVAHGVRATPFRVVVLVHVEMLG